MSTEHRIGIVGDEDIPEGMQGVDPFKGLGILLSDCAMELELGRMKPSDAARNIRKIAETCFEMSNLLNDDSMRERFESEMRAELTDEIKSFVEDNGDNPVKAKVGNPVPANMAGYL